jgi:hypothetical protein
VNAIKVDDEKRIRLPMAQPGDYYTPEAHGENEIVLRKVPAPTAKRTKAEILRALESSSLRFECSWDELKKLTR